MTQRTHIIKIMQAVQHSLFLVLVCVLFAVTQPAIANDDKIEEDKPEETAPPSVLVNVTTLADTAQRATSDRFNQFVLQIDDFFGDAESEASANSSWGRLRIDGIKPGAEDWEAKVRLKVRVVLPQAERRLRLLVSTEDADVDGSRGRTNIDSGNNDQNVALGLRFVRTITDAIKLNFDIGARIRDKKGQVFGRISASNTTDLGRGWEAQISNNFYLYSASGYQNRFKFDIRRPINRSASVFFRSSTTFSGEKGIGGAAAGETLGIYADLSSRTAIALEGLFSFVTSEDEVLNTRYLGAEYRIRFRQNIWRPWFFYEIWPSVFYEASNDRERAYGGLIRVEMLFGQY